MDKDKEIRRCGGIIVDHIDYLGDFIDIDSREIIQEQIRLIDERLQFLKQKIMISLPIGIDITQVPARSNTDGPMPIICVETGKIYESVEAASKDTGINAGNIHSCVFGKIKSIRGFRFVPYLEEGERPLHIEPRRRKVTPVMCVETGVVYKTIKEAGESTTINPSTISSCINGKTKTAGGYHWRRVDPEGKPID